MIVVSSSLVLSESNLTADHPIVGFRNIVTVDNIVSTDASDNYPVTNLANPATHLKWQAAANSPPTSPQYVTVTTGGADPIDYVGIAKHNFGAIEAQVVVQGDSGFGFLDLTSAVVPGDDSPILFRFSPASFTDVRVKISSPDAPPEAAVLFVGKLLVLPRRIWQSHTPINFGRKQKLANGRSEGGGFLGSILLGSWTEGRINTSLIDPDNYREDVDEWIEASVYDRQTFVFGWRPQSYPNEVGYCWATNEAQPKNSSGHGLTELDMQIAGIV